MTAPVHYGRSQAEKMAEENAVARQIVQQITNFGVSQRQVLMVMYLLASELENVEHMRALTSLIRQLGADDLFLIGRPILDGEIGGQDGTLDV